MILKKLIVYILILIFSYFFYFNFQNLYANKDLNEVEFFCKGSYQTFINKYPLEITIKNNKLSWNIILPNEDDMPSLTQMWNGDISIEELKELFIGPSIITIFYSLYILTI